MLTLGLLLPPLFIVYRRVRAGPHLRAGLQHPLRKISWPAHAPQDAAVVVRSWRHARLELSPHLRAAGSGGATAQERRAAHGSRVSRMQPDHAGGLVLPRALEPVWTNNEYDIISALVTEIMRTGRHDMWKYARWFARHTIEVDFIHYSDHKQQHRSTPQHSYNTTTRAPSPATSGHTTCSSITA
jgi:hypothetical protein